MKYATPLFRALAATSLLLAAGIALGQTYPTRPVRLIVPLAAGGSGDIIARTMAQKLTETWGQSVLVDNRPGGATIIGTDIVAKAAPDGHTMVLSPATFCTNPTLFPGKLPYDTARDFSLVVLVNTSPLVLVVHPNVQANTVKELIALAKAQQGRMNYGSSTVGGTGHLSAELLNFMGDVKIQHIPYKGNAPALADLMAERVTFVFNGTTSVLPLIQAGRLRPLGVTGLTRTSALPDVPTMDEAGLKGFSATSWNGLITTGKTPSAIIAKINADANKAIASADMLQRLKNDGSEPGGGTVQQFTAFVNEETLKWARIIKAANIQPE